MSEQEAQTVTEERKLCACGRHYVGLVFQRGTRVMFRAGKQWSGEDIGGQAGYVEQIHEYPLDVVDGGVIYGVERATLDEQRYGGIVFTQACELKLA